AQHATVEWGPRRKFDLTVGLNYALVVLGAPASLAIAALAVAWGLGQGLWLCRRDAQGRPRRGWRSAAVNCAQAVLAVRASSTAYRQVAASGAAVWAPLAAALVLYAVNTGLVAIMVALHTGRP